MTVVAVLAGVAWYVIGCAGFIFWWTKDWDFTPSDAVAVVFIGWLGPLAWLVGWGLHGGHDRRSRVLIAKRSPR